MNKKLSIFLNSAIFCLLFFYSTNCSPEAPSTTKEEESAKIIKEYPVYEIPLPSELAEQSTEISGLAWYEDQLIILPQYPKRIAKNDTSCFFGISKQNLKKYIYEKDNSALNFYRVNIIYEGLKEYFKIGSGFEAIEFAGKEVFLTIESLRNDKTQSFIIKGIINFENKLITLDEHSIIKIDYREDIYNLSHETITKMGRILIPIYEVNGKSFFDSPQVSMFDLDLHFKKKLSFPIIEYRITDATSADSSGKFWVINYFWPGDYDKLSPHADVFVKNFGVGKTHKKSPIVERLLEFQIFDDKIGPTVRAPIYLELESESRNWEGLAKLDELGFILASDTFPRTILAFIPFVTSN